MASDLIDPQALQVVSKTPPDEARHKKRAETFVALANRLTVETAEDFELAAGELRTIKTFWNELETERTSFTDPLNALLKRMNERFQPYLKALCGDGKAGTVSAESIIKGKMAAFQRAEQARIAAENAERERLAAVERKRLADEAAAVLRKAQEEAEAARKAEEARQAAARADQQRIDAEVAAARGKKAKEEAAQRAAEARAAEETRQAQAQREAEAAAVAARASAAALEQTAAVVIARPVEQAAVRGISAPKTLDFEITDKAGFLRFALDQRPDLLALWELDAAKMRALIKLQGEATTIPGLRVFSKTGITVRA